MAVASEGAGVDECAIMHDASFTRNLWVCGSGGPIGRTSPQQLQFVYVLNLLHPAELSPSRAGEPDMGKHACLRMWPRITGPPTSPNLSLQEGEGARGRHQEDHRAWQGELPRPPSAVRG